MATPDWFDPVLRSPAPRRVRATGMFAFVRLGLLALAALPLYFGLRPEADLGRARFLVAVPVLAVVITALWVERWARRYRRLLATGRVALGRLVPFEPTPGDQWAYFLTSGEDTGEARVTVHYEYPTETGACVRAKLRVTADGDRPRMFDGRFPEGLAPGARLLVLFDPGRPEDHVLYDPRALLRIVGSAS